jgi:hypothetical protein
LLEDIIRDFVDNFEEVEAVHQGEMIQKLASLSENGRGQFGDFFSLGFRVFVEDLDFSGIVMKDSEDRLDSCGFPRSIWSDESDFFSLLDIERN